MATGTAILEAFYQAAGQFVGAGELARLARVPAERVVAAITELQALGYKIESHPHFGYRLLEAPDRLTADDIRARLKPRVMASTNDVVAHLARNGAREGLVVFAESQTRGRGRHGRVWASPRGKGLWFSVLLRPPLPASAAQRLTVAASVAVARAVRQVSSVDARIKWPNDVTARGRKLAGILTELHAESDEILFAILGIGIDVNCAREELPEIATSLQIETGKAQDRTALAAMVLSELDDCYRLARTDFERVSDEWAALCTTLGRQIVVTMGARRIEGHAQALDGDGALLLRKDNGQTERIVGGDVVVERT
jgi:BirA family biotin operon repressor/biotin-[acetyl-CoA-carboxylase] ligase